MALQKQDGLFTDTGLSGADLRNKENRLVKNDGTGKLVLCGAAEYALGVISEGRDVGYHTSYNTEGNPLLRIEAGAAIAADTYVSSDATGRVVAGTINVFGRTTKAVGAAGIIAEIKPGRVADAVDNT
jgi:hypothetical protein